MAQIHWQTNARNRVGLAAETEPHQREQQPAGVDIEDIADAAGHINSSVTRNVYRHQIAGKVTRAPAAMDAIFGQVRGS
jgi:hypothetical protein